MKVVDTITLPVSINDVYGAPMNSLSSNLGRRQQFTDFRFIRSDESGVKFMSLSRQVKQHDPSADYRFGGPRLIVGDIPRKQFTFTETGEERIPQSGEWYMNENGVIAQAQEYSTFATPYLIVERTAIELPPTA